MYEEIINIKQLRTFDKEKTGIFIDEFSHYKGEIQSIIGGKYSGRVSLADSINKIYYKNRYNIEGYMNFKGLEIEDLNREEFEKWVFSKIKLLPQHVNDDYGKYQKVKEIFRKLGIEKDYNKKIMEKEFFINPSILEEKYGDLQSLEQMKLVLFIAYLQNPELLVLLDPFESWDIVSRMELMKIVMFINEDLETSIIFTTGDERIGFEIAHQLTYIEDGQIMKIDRIDNTN